MPKAAFIQLARYGDIASILPVVKQVANEGYQVDMFVHAHFASLLEACSYVRPVVWHGLHRDVVGATNEAVKAKYGRIIVSQVDGNPQPSAEQANFIRQQWTRAGYIEQFHDLPLIFDKRNYYEEEQSIRNFWPKGHGQQKPVLVYSLEGVSSPFPQKAEFERWLIDNFSSRYDLLNLGALKLSRVHHLLAFLDRTSVLLSIDSLPIHLAYATGTPTIVLSRDVAWYQSESRQHWIARVEYPASVTPVGQNRITEALERNDLRPGRMLVPNQSGEKVWHVTDWYLGNKNDNRRILNARKTWDRIAAGDDRYELVLHQIRDGQRTSRDLGDKRKLPYITDIIDRGCEYANGDDIVIFTNSDVCLVPECIDQVRRRLADAPCCYSRRIDVTDGAIYRTAADLIREEAHVGADLFAFRVSFWREHGHEVPDLFLSCEGWDWVARVWCEQYNPAAEMKPPVIWHERHQSWWARPENIIENPGQKHNREACIAWCRANGLDVAIFGQESRYLFKPDYQWKAELSKQNHAVPA